MLRKIIILAGIAVLTTACSTISEETCIEQSWESLGYDDGRKGKSRGTFSKIAETCTKYGVSADSYEYFSGYDKGLPLYCAYDKGYDHGEGGRSVKSECLEINAVSYLDGYDDGRIIYEIKQEYEARFDDYEDVRADIEDVSYRLTDETLEPKERKRLKKKLRRLDNELDDIRFEIRSLERDHGWSKCVLTTPNYGGAIK